MNVIVPFGYYVGADVINYDFKDLRKDDRIVLNGLQRFRNPDAQHTIDIQTQTQDYCTEHYLRILETYPALRDLIEARFNMFAYKILGKDYKFKISTSWLTKLEAGDGIHPHSHHNCYYSGILYFGKDYSDAVHLVLGNPVPDTVSNSFPFGDEHNIMATDFTLQPFTGALYFWPSHIKHFSGPHMGESRVSLPFNLVATENIYNGDSTIKAEWVKPVNYEDADD